MRGLVQTLKRIPGARSLRRAVIHKKKDRTALLADYFTLNSIGAEVGVHLGNFSEKLLSVFTPRELHLIDPWHYENAEAYRSAWYGGKAPGKQREMDERFENVQARFSQQVKDGIIVIHRDASQRVLMQFPDHYFDWIYVDGNHLYDCVRRDIEISLSKVKSGGFVAGDDYCEGGWWEGGVKKAVDEIAALGEARLVDVRHAQFVFSVP